MDRSQTRRAKRSRTHLLIGAPVAALVLASPMLMNCSALNALGVENPDCGAEFDAGDFSKTKADASLKGFLDASAQFNKAVNKVEVDLVGMCRELGKAIGVPDADMAGEPNGDGEVGKKACGAVSAKISAMIKANADASIVVTVGAPSCGASLETMMDCWKNCGSPIEPGKLEAGCEGGHLSGECSAKCEGSCTVEGSAECKGTCGGSCEGSCKADFRGQCGGKCDGKCDGKDSKGAECKGTCEGSCDVKAKGVCGGSCEGKCDASCKMDVQAECKGTCEGKCSVDFKAPKCDVEFKPPKVSIDCQAKCAVDAAAHIECTPPTVKVVAKGKVTTELDTLVLALQKHLPKIMKIGVGTAKALINSSGQLVTKVGGLVEGAASLGIHTAGCVGFAAKALGEVKGKLEASVDVSVSVSASASGSASTK